MLKRMLKTPPTPHKTGGASILDQIAERIAAAKDSAERASAIADFRIACQNNPKGPLNPALEAANRNVALVNPL